MVYLIIILRFLHILSGIFWVGFALMITFYISPAVQATQESGQKFFSYLLQHTNLSKFITVTALVSVLAGFSLYWINSNGFQSDWMKSGPGLGFGLGAVAALLGLHYGLLQNKRSKAMIQLGQKIQAQASPPTDEQRKSIQKLQTQLKTGGKLNAIFLLLASILMATARFWVF